MNIKKTKQRKKINFVFIILIFLFILTTTKVKAAHAVCGKVDNSINNVSVMWRSVIIYYHGDKGNNISCQIGENNKYCCDSEAIPEHAWKIGNIIFVEVLDFGDGYKAGPVNTIMTGSGYDIMPEMTLKKIINLHSPTHSIFTESPILLNITTIYENTIWYNLDNEKNTTLCANCNHTEKLLNPGYGQHEISVYVNDSQNNIYKESNSFAILSEIDFSRSHECGGCRKNKVPPLTDINMSIEVNLSHEINSFYFIDYYPKNWNLVNMREGAIENYSETHNKMYWLVSGKEISKSYIIQSPNKNNPPIEYTFQSEIDGQLSGEWKVKVVGKITVITDYIYSRFKKLLKRL